MLISRVWQFPKSEEVGKCDYKVKKGGYMKRGFPKFEDAKQTDKKRCGCWASNAGLLPGKKGRQELFTW